LNYDEITDLAGTPVKIFYWCLIIIGLCGIMLPIVTFSMLEDSCENYVEECPDDVYQAERDASASIGAGIIMTTVGGGIGMAFLIRCRATVAWKRKRSQSPCKSYRENGKHTYDLTDVKLEYTIEKGAYNTMYHTFKSKPVKCEHCDKTKKVVMSTTMEDYTY
jgi:hypothetical protein